MGKIIEQKGETRKKKKRKRNIKRLNLQVKNRPWHSSRVYRVRERAVRVAFLIIYIMDSGLFARR